jgi:hypothetical protein
MCPSDSESYNIAGVRDKKFAAIILGAAQGFKALLVL